jgi:uncharacterized protein
MRNLLLATIGSLCFWPVAQAAEISVVPTDKPNTSVIYLEGRLEPADVDRFRSIAADVSGGVVVFNSNGGSLGAGLEIGRLIHSRQFATYVGNDTTCTSSCALAWLAGSPRAMATRARVGFHAAYSVDENGAKTESSSANALVGAYLNKLGFADETVEFVTNAHPNAISWLDQTLAKTYGITVVLLNNLAPIVAKHALSRRSDSPLPSGDSYGGDGSNLPSTSVGPSFNCSGSKTEFQALVCADDKLSRADLQLVQPYMALRYTVGEQGYGALQAEADSFVTKTTADCGINQRDKVKQIVEPVRQCVLSHYATQYVSWMGRLSGPALEEASRPPADNRLCQYRLNAAGFLQTSVRANGVLDRTSRQGIKNWQLAVKHPPTGFLSDDDFRQCIE